MEAGSDRVEPGILDGLLGLRGRSVLVLGCGPGIGGETADVLAAAGARVWVADIKQAVAEEAAERLTSAGGAAFARSVDVLDREAIDGLTDEVAAAEGGIAGVVDVVGLCRFKPYLDTVDADWEDMFALNLRHQFYAAQASARQMSRRGGGSYVAIASINGTHSSPGSVPYGAMKAALVSMIRSAAQELGAAGVRFNAIAPGVVETPRLRVYLRESGRMEEFAEAIPMARVGEANEVAKAALFLVSDLASYVTGQVVAVDGGASIKYPLAMVSDGAW